MTSLWKVRFLLAVICLSDDDNDDIIPDETSTTSANLNKGNDSSTTEKDPDEKDVNDPSNWIIQQKDIIRIPELPSNFSDIYKKPFEIRCTTIRFGVVEFSVDCEVVLMKEMEFEMRLKGKWSLSRKQNIRFCFFKVVFSTRWVLN